MVNHRNTRFIAFDLFHGVEVTQHIVQYPLHHVTYAPAKFAVATSKGLGEDAFTRKYIVWSLTLGQGHMKRFPVPSTSCDLCIYKVSTSNS